MIHKLVMSPFNLLIKVGGKVKEEVDKELYDIEHIQKKLAQLQMMHELGDLSDEAFEAKEEELMERYEVAKQLEMEQLNAEINREK
ncbi:gas vesicle protein GvpG [Thalassobacillus hwangdonensis]|uniref:Gas vesicle protein GvpG n=1 Tax=Thalassobacillus hwangdonensis TaxID=546108 RepID=A0ABW3L5T5_9BACI